MLLHNLKLTLRSLKNSKLFSFITILGLSVGMAATILLFIYVEHELSFDRFNTRAPRIIRMISILGQDKSWTMPICTRFTDSSFARQIPEVEQVVQLYANGPTEVVVNNQRFKNIDLLYTDPNIAKVFSIEFIEGDPETALIDPSSVVISSSVANKLFGKTNAVGKTILVESKPITVSGIIKDLPSSSHFPIEMLRPFSSYPFLNNLGGLEFYTYILIRDGANMKDGVHKCEQLYAKQLSDRFKSSGYKTGCYTQKLTDIHLYSDFPPRSEVSGSITKVYIYSVLALLILAIAIINFVNLLTVQYEGKTRDIGVQKAIGGSRGVIIRQFMGKSITFSLIALVIAMIIVEFTIADFGPLVNRNLVLSYAQNSWLLFLLPVFAIGVGIISGLYPAFYLSKFTTLQVLKGEINKVRGTNLFTTTLVIFQFTVAIVLMSSIIIMHRQITYMKSIDLGFNASNVLCVNNLNNRIRQSYPAIKDALLKLPEVETVSASDHLPGGGASGEGIRVAEDEAEISINCYRVQSDYFKALQIHLITGKVFGDNLNSDSASIILNEAAISKLGITDDPLNADVYYDGTKVSIIGVVKNFHYSSLQNAIEPLVFIHRSYGLNYILVRFANTELEKNLKSVENTLKQFDPDYEMDYLLVDDYCRNRYRDEEQSSYLSTAATVLSLILALLGLYALTMFMVNKRIKEIGVRKVSGATNFQITTLLLYTFIKWIGIAFIISVPLSYYITNRWLQNYAYHISINAWPYITAGVAALFVAILTVGWQTWRAASRNPVEALKYE